MTYETLNAQYAKDVHTYVRSYNAISMSRHSGAETKTHWLFQPWSGYPGYRQAEEAVVVRGNFGIGYYYTRQLEGKQAQIVLTILWFADLNH